MESNKVADTLLWTGTIIIILALIAGYVSGQPGNRYDDFLWGTALTWWGGGITSGILIIGFSEIVKILHESRHYTYQSYLLQGGEPKVEKDTFEPLRPNF
ncbi:hypothetical protein D3C74_83500 [compost metagenome]